ncbi:unnamed protein product [Polarella glacialis]|uniref:RING-type domain-containing protein n=1 Tax=Polarella glacialis TaxID=89957 RepID=A0A813LAK0_POLGL|nr:unnamed protein product [Polarella glacialis]|mmetsp:Transcript_18932/g.30253  ORF Transcript_18932/g.30253 Transcript_18932/m.30253 type:complete len:273 (+) Transcript_18932:93-911(+)
MQSSDGRGAEGATFITAPPPVASFGARRHSATRSTDHAAALREVTQILDLPPEERSANLERYARCMTVRFRRRKANQEELDLQALMPSSLAQSPEVWEYTSCAICLCEFAEGEELRRAPCAGGHAFHPKCLRGWLDRSHATCPVCRGGEGDGRGGRSKPQGGRFGADALAEFVTRRMRSGKVDLTVSKANHERAEMAIRQLRDPMPCLKPEVKEEPETKATDSGSKLAKATRPKQDLDLPAIFSAALTARKAEQRAAAMRRNSSKTEERETW